MDHSRDDRYRSLDLSLRSPPVLFSVGCSGGREGEGERLCRFEDLGIEIDSRKDSLCNSREREREFQFLGFFVYLEIYLGVIA